MLRRTAAAAVFVLLLWPNVARADGDVDVGLDDDGDTVVLDASETGNRAGNDTRRTGGTTGNSGNTPAGASSAAPAPVDPKDPDDTECPGAAVVLNAASCMGTMDPNPPGGGGAPPLAPDDLGAQAAARIPLDAPSVHLTPGPGKTGLVGLPTWLWVDATPTAWGPATATAAVPGLSVTATARVDHITWTMGDGAVVTCTTPGTPYTPTRGAQRSPDCGHTYTRPGVHTVTATTHWTVTWAGGGQTGTLVATRTTTVGDIRVGEMQALTS